MIAMNRMYHSRSENPSSPTQPPYPADLTSDLESDSSDDESLLNNRGTNNPSTATQASVFASSESRSDRDFDESHHEMQSRNTQLPSHRHVRTPLTPRRRHIRSHSSQASDSPVVDPPLRRHLFEDFHDVIGTSQYRKRRRANPDEAVEPLTGHSPTQYIFDNKINKFPSLSSNRLGVEDVLGPMMLFRPLGGDDGSIDVSITQGYLLCSNVAPETALPPRIAVGSPSLIFTSELFPRRFGKKKRAMLNSVLRSKSKLVPAAVRRINGLSKPIVYYVSDRPLSAHAQLTSLPLGPGRRGWPAGSLPVEVFNAITSYLSRESVQAMRLVNAEFERKTSNKLFHTVVVPFRSEIYGLMTRKDKMQAVAKHGRSSKGKGKARATLETPEATDRTIHDGMKVFEAWGPHIKRFAMAFEVDETALENAPSKGKFEQHMTWWGGYQWPHPYYNRYEVCECLEKKADEFRCMSKALSYLQQTKELGLSLDSGLGWLSGPDKSDRARMFEQKPEVFGQNHLLPGIKETDAEHIWDDLVDSARRVDQPQTRHIEGESIEVQVRFRNDQKQISLMDTAAPSSHRPVIFEGVDVAANSSGLNPEEQTRYAVEGLAALSKPDDSRYSKASLKPSDLTIAQQEWLLETEWAQRAFLSSFCMALCDNASVFASVHTLNISSLSSRYLSALQRDDIWAALPNVSQLILMVSPDWRNISKTDTGLVEACDIKPSTAASYFYALLDKSITKVSNIKTLTLGYTTGGEHQTGIFGRNKSILPAPLTDSSDSRSILQPLHSILKLPHIRELTLTNCWMTPNMLKAFASPSRIGQLEHLFLKSVSLTADTDVPQRDSLEMNPLDGRYDVAQGPPRRVDASVGNFFSMRANQPFVPDPPQYGWVTKGQRVGSWGNVINAITPGPTMDFTRYAYQYLEERPKIISTTLERLTFESCGYVRLTNFSDFHQLSIGNVVDRLPNYLIKRAVELFSVMMSRSNDALLGQIVPALDEEDTDALSSAFPMRFQWNAADADKSLENREDGQPNGGVGRFSGVIGKLVVPQLD